MEGGVKTLVKDMTTYKRCYADVSYKTGNTLNMVRHMKLHHPDIRCCRGTFEKPKQQKLEILLLPSIGHYPHKGLNFSHVKFYHDLSTSFENLLRKP